MVGGLVFLVFWLLLLFFGIAGTVLWIWMLIDCAVNEPSTGNDKIVWILVIVFAHGLGALIYLIARRPARMARYGR